jgi:hypothetical protein
MPLFNTSVTPGDNAMVLESLFFGDSSPEEKVFTALLTRPAELPGFFTFGSIDEETVGNQTINYADNNIRESISLTNQSLWTVSAPEFSVNGKSIPNPGGFAIIDNSWPYITLPAEVVSEIYTPIGGQEIDDQWYLPVGISPADLPLVSLGVGNHSVQLAPLDTLVGQFSGLNSSLVLGSIQPLWPGAPNVSFYGVPFLWNVYAVFDLANGNPEDMRFGFVPRAPEV